MPDLTQRREWPAIKCAIFNPAIQAAVPQELRERMEKDRERVLIEKHGEKRLTVMEPLSWKAPSIARPYCCYINTVIFYVYPYVLACDGGFLEWDRVDYLLAWDTDFLFDGRIYRAGGGRVIRYRKGWWMRSWAKVSAEPATPELVIRELGKTANMVASGSPNNAIPTYG